MTAGTVIQFRRTPDIDAVLEWLQRDTGMTNQSDMIRFFLKEAAKTRGMPSSAGGSAKVQGRTKAKGAKKGKA